MASATVEKSVPAVLIQLPKEGYELYFKEEGHIWQRVNDKGLPGIRYPGTSTISKAVPSDPDPLIKWGERLTLAGIASLSAAGIAIPTDPWILRQLLEDHGLRWEQVRDEAGKRGRDVHREMLEALALGKDIPDLEALDEEHQGYGQAVFRWWKKRNPKPLSVEQTVLSLEYGVAGRLDLRAEIEVADEEILSGIGPRWLVDLKTGNYISERDHVQVEGYELQAKECGIGGTDTRMILQVKADGTFVEHFSVATEEDFLVCVDSHKRKLRMGRDLRAQLKRKGK